MDKWPGLASSTGALHGITGGLRYIIGGLRCTTSLTTANHCQS